METEKMSRCWDEYALRDAMFYVDTSRRHWTEEEFFAGERGFIDSLLAWLPAELPRERCLEIGCGLGRLLRHLAPHFRQLDGCDISRQMLERAHAAGLPSNVEVRGCSGSDLASYADDRFDLVLSFLVFQHIPSAAVIASYLAETARVLNGGGLAIIQFDTRPPSVASRLVHVVPDPLLPRLNRACIRRYRRDPDAIAAAARRGGLELADERDRRSERHLMMFRPAAARQ